uniref:Uncharacterized protein n=1 Tax=viral metagenome TaxID=1070528 RepID=A0A6C0D9F2_9ZZZZ
MDFELPQIYNYNDTSDLVYIFFGILSLDVIVLFLTRYYKVGGKYLNEWYDQFNILAVLADVMIILIGFLITRFIYTNYIFEKFEYSLIYFLITLVAVQAVHDIFFYKGVIQPIPYGQNEMMDVFKKYAEDLGASVIGGDALLMIGSAFIALFYKYIPTSAFVSIASLFVYALPYILFTRNPYSIVVEVKKDEKKVDVSKEGVEDPKLDAYKRMVGL